MERNIYRPIPENIVYHDSYSHFFNNLQKSGKIITYGSIGVLSFLFIVMLFLPSKRQSKVVDVHWQINVDTRVRTIYNDEGWESSMHNHYFNVHDCRQRVSGQHECGRYVCGSTTNQTSGQREDTYCSVYCDDYSTWCAYSYYDWPISNHQEYHGHDHEIPQLQQIHPSCVSDNEDISRITNVCNEEVIYFSVLFDSENLLHHPSSRHDFMNFNVGDIWTIHKNNIFSDFEPTTMANR